jgi:hypothetical protein
LFDFNWKEVYRKSSNDELLSEIATLFQYEIKLILDLPGSKTQVGEFVNKIISIQFKITEIIEVIAERAKDV